MCKKATAAAIPSEFSCSIRSPYRLATPKAASLTLANFATVLHALSQPRKLGFPATFLRVSAVAVYDLIYWRNTIGGQLDEKRQESDSSGCGSSTLKV